MNSWAPTTVTREVTVQLVAPGDGSVALILDVVHLVTAGQQQEAHLRAAG